jgi:hypothetical protein
MLDHVRSFNEASGTGACARFQQSPPADAVPEIVGKLLIVAAFASTVACRGIRLIWVRPPHRSPNPRIVALMRRAIPGNMPSPNARSSLGMIAQLGFDRHAPFVSLFSKADMLMGSCESHRKAALASSRSAANPA